MIKFTFEHINKHSLESSLRKLMGTQFNNIKLSHDVHVICTKILKAIEEKRTSFTKGILELAEKDADGKPLFENGAPKISDENQAAVEKLTKETLAGEIVIEKHKLHHSLLDKASLTPMDVSGLMPMIDGLEEPEVLAEV